MEYDGTFFVFADGPIFSSSVDAMAYWLSIHPDKTPRDARGAIDLATYLYIQSQLVD